MKSEDLIKHRIYYAPLLIDSFTIFLEHNGDWRTSAFDGESSVVKESVIALLLWKSNSFQRMSGSPWDLVITFLNTQN
jgi:hypothetical protein